MQNIYNPEFIEDLFDKMSGSYARMNYITSFGFSARWRRQFISSVPIREGQTVADLMTGMGECWPYIIKKSGKTGKIIGLDFSEGMLQFAHKRRQKLDQYDIAILKENIFDNSIPGHSVDVVISGFGIKTFSEAQLIDFANEIKRILKPGGRLSLIDVSVPASSLLRIFYMSYLKLIIPLLGKIFLGNPETYKMLGVYTGNFNNAKKVKAVFEKQGFQIEYMSYFFGCATGINGRL